MPGNEFLLTAITVLQEDLLPDDFLRAVLGEIQKKLLIQIDSASEGDQTAFLEKTLAELSSRLLLEKELRSEIKRLSEECDALREKQTQAESQNTLRLRYLAINKDEEIRSLKEQRVMVAKQNTKIRMDFEAKIARLESEVERLSEKTIQEEWQAAPKHDMEIRNHDYMLDTSDGLRECNKNLSEKFHALEKQCVKVPSRTAPLHVALPTIASMSRFDNDSSSDDSEDQLSVDSSSDLKSSDKSKSQTPLSRNQVVTRGSLLSIASNLPCGPLFELRRKSLEASRFCGSLPQRTNISIFNRRLLWENLGGNPISPQVRIARGSEMPLAKRLGISAYMCPSLELHPWAPSLPGENGFMFAEVVNDKTHSQSETQDVFVRFACNSMFYAGRYKCSKVDALSPDEWNHLLKEKFKRTHCKIVRRRAKEERDVDAIMAAYNQGSLRVPCVLLECVDYKLELNGSLSKLPMATHLSSSGPSSSTNIAGSDIQYRKRKHVIVDSENAELQTKKVRSGSAFSKGRNEQRKRLECENSLRIRSDDSSDDEVLILSD